MQYSFSIPGLDCYLRKFTASLQCLLQQKTIEVFRQKVGEEVPIIHYAKGSGHLHSDIRDLDLNAISLDWRDNLAVNREQFGDKYAFQGNLDPSLLHGSTETAKLATRQVLDAAGDKPGHIFNLGHGLLPETPIKNVHRFIELIRRQ